MFRRTARWAWLLVCALSLSTSLARAGHLPELADLVTSDRLGYRCLPPSLDRIARQSRAEQGAASRPLPRRCIVDACQRLTEPGLGRYLGAPPTRRQWADYQARYHAQCHRRDWRPIRPGRVPVNLSVEPARCSGTGGQKDGAMALLLAPDGAERIYPVDWRARLRLHPSQWHRYPQFETATLYLPDRRLAWPKAVSHAPLSTERAIWAARRGTNLRQSAGLRHVGPDAESCGGAGQRLESVVVPPLTPVPLPGGALHLVAGVAVLAMLRRRGLHRGARRD